jgi:hypothetical protein
MTAIPVHLTVHHSGRRTARRIVRAFRRAGRAAGRFMLEVLVSESISVRANPDAVALLSRHSLR